MLLIITVRSLPLSIVDTISLILTVFHLDAAGGISPKIVNKIY